MSAIDFITAADTVNLQAGGESLFSRTMSGVSNMPAYAGAAALSAINSMYNTGVDLSNKVFGIDLDRADTGMQLSRLNASWAQLYEENKEGVDMLGFIAGSFVPGTLAVKALKAAQAGKSFGAMRSVLGFTVEKESHYLKAALTEIASEGGSVFSRINGNKMLAMAWGTADVALQTAAFETATALTMKASPIIDKEDLSTVLWDVTKTSLAGGAIGGIFNAAIINRTLKDAIGLVDKKYNKYNVLANISKSDLAAGDKAYGILDAIARLPKEVLELETKIPFAKAADGILDTTALFEKTLRRTKDSALTQFEDTLTHIVPNDLTVGRAAAGAFRKLWDEGITAGKSAAEVRDTLATYLHNLEEIAPLGSKATTFDGELVWLGKDSTVDGLMAKGAVRSESANTPYRYVGSKDDTRIGIIGKNGDTAEEVFRNQFDVALDPATKKIKISPFSNTIKKIDIKDAEQTSLFFNTRTRQTSHDTVPTIADVAAVGAPVVSPSGVNAGTRSFAFSVGVFNDLMDSVGFTARHLWAADPKNGVKFIGGTIDSRDMSLLDALLARPHLAQADLKIFDKATGVTREFSEIHDFNTFVFKQKMAEMDKLLKASDKVDAREVAYRLNMDTEIIEIAAATGGDPKALYESGKWLRNGTDYAERENLIFRYNTAAMKDAGTFPEANVAYYQRVKLAMERNKAVSTAVLGNDVAKQLMSLEETFAQHASSLGAGATTLGAANANYGDVMSLWAQSTGKIVALATTERSNQALATFQTPAARIVTNPKAAAELAALRASVHASDEPLALYYTMAEGHMLVDLASLKQIKTAGATTAFKKRIDLSPEVGELMETYQNLHRKWVGEQATLYRTQGLPFNVDPDKLYMPPVDTRKLPFFAFVQQQEGRVFGTSETAMISARDAESLSALAANVEKAGFKVIYKADTEEYFKAKGLYDFSRAMNNPTIEPLLKSKGLLGGYLPNMTPESVIEDFVLHIQRQESKIVRDAVSVHYAQAVAELEDMSARSLAVQTSKFEGLTSKLLRTKADPYGDAIKTALNISKRSEFVLLHQLNEFVDAVGSRAFRGVEKAMLDARHGKITWQEANDQLDKFGIGRQFDSEKMFELAQRSGDRNLIKQAVHKANMILGAGVIRLDWANSLMNIISTPILQGTELASIRNSIKNNSELVGKLTELTSEAIPGQTFRVPSATRMTMTALKSLFNPEERKAFMARFRTIGTVKGQVAQFHSMIDDLSITPNFLPSKWSEKVDGWVEKAATWTGNNHAEDYTRYVSSHIMHQLTDPLVKAGKMSIQEANAYINVFVNRVQGNYIASQRPILFQGTVGSAIGLFQTYQFNLFQQLFRHVENKDLKAVMTLGGIQTSLFGLNGLPYFDAINTQLIGGASINESHTDTYSYATKVFGKEYGDWLMYGSASAFPLFSEKAPALYTRGDINPRSAFFVPVDPRNVPAVQGTLKIANNLINMGERIMKGGGVAESLLFGLEHNGINRPLAGLAQVLKGSATTSKGDLIAAADDIYSISSMARLIGAKPMDESIALNAMYRNRAYQAMDKERIELLGSVIKEKIRNGGVISSEEWIDFQGKYAAAGGRAEGFSKAVQRWSKHANTSVINELARHNNTMEGRRLMELLGGDMIEDFAANSEQKQE